MTLLRSSAHSHAVEMTSLLPKLALEGGLCVTGGDGVAELCDSSGAECLLTCGLGAGSNAEMTSGKALVVNPHRSPEKEH